MNTGRQTFFWIFLLLGGAWIVSAVTCRISLPGPHGVGRFSYSFRYTLEPDFHEALDEEMIDVVTIEGKAPGRFTVDGWKAPQYQEVSMKWMMFSGASGGETKGACWVDLSKRQIVNGAERLPLEQSTLRSLFGLKANSEPSDLFLNDLQAKLEAAASGTMPRPQHHTYSFDEPPTRGRLQHFAQGVSVQFPVLVWAGIWLFLVLATVTIKRAHKARSQHPALSEFQPS